MSFASGMRQIDLSSTSAARASGSLVLVLALVLATAVAVAGEDDIASERDVSEAPAVYVTYGTGFDFSRGDYGLDRDSSLYYVPFSWTIDVEYWRFVVRVPFLHSDGVIGSAVAGPTGLESDRVSGLGDTITSLSYLFAPLEEGLPWIEVGGQISWPTRTREPLGQGDFAFAAQVDLFQTYGDWTPFARVGRNFNLVGSLEDRFYTSIGASHAWNDSFATGLSYDWLESVVRGLRDGHEIVPYLSIDFDGGWNLDPYAVIGLSSGSPDFGVGLSVTLER